MGATTAIRTRGRLYLPEKHLFTREEFEKIAESGAFPVDARLELIEGDIVIQEEPMKAGHAGAVRRCEKACARIFGEGYDVRGQLPLALAGRNEPLADVAVVVGSSDDYEVDHPTTAVLVIEVSQSTLRYDRTTKENLYARAGIRDYWILNLIDRRLEVHRNPVPTSGQPLGYGYADVTVLGESESVTPLAAPNSRIAVADLLPRL